MAILYTRIQNVIELLRPKVRVDDTGQDENKMSLAMLKILIEQAEGDVELELARRYAVPLQTKDGKEFKLLPERPTKQVISTLCELKSIMRVMTTDFGKGTAVAGDKYYDGQKKIYDELMGKVTNLREHEGQKTFGQWLYPPLPNLMVNYFNTEADDGFAGEILVTSQGYGAFPGEQINNPSQNFWNGTLDNATDLDGRNGGDIP